MDITPLTSGDKAHLFFRPRITLIWYVLLAVTWIPFFFTDIEWKPLSEVKIEDDLAALLITQLVSWSFLFLLLTLHRKRMNFMRKAHVAWGKAKPLPDSMRYVRGFQKAYRMKGVYLAGELYYPITTSLITQVDFDQEYDFPVMYDPENPRKVKPFFELPKKISKKLMVANGFEEGAPI